MKRPKIRTTLNLQVDVYGLLSTAVEEGVTYGWNRAHKHTDDPSPEAVKAEIERAIMNNLCETFIFPERC